MQYEYSEILSYLFATGKQQKQKGSFWFLSIYIIITYIILWVYVKLSYLKLELSDGYSGRMQV